MLYQYTWSALATKATPENHTEILIGQKTTDPLYPSKAASTTFYLRNVIDHNKLGGIHYGDTVEIIGFDSFGTSSPALQSYYQSFEPSGRAWWVCTTLHNYKNDENEVVLSVPNYFRPLYFGGRQLEVIQKYRFFKIVSPPEITPALTGSVHQNDTISILNVATGSYVRIQPKHFKWGNVWKTVIVGKPLESTHHFNIKAKTVNFDKTVIKTPEKIHAAQLAAIKKASGGGGTV